MMTKYDVLYEAISQAILPLKDCIVKYYFDYNSPNEKYNLNNISVSDVLDFASCFMLDMEDYRYDSDIFPLEVEENEC